METRIVFVSGLKKGDRPLYLACEASEYTVLSVTEYDDEILVEFIHDDCETYFVVAYEVKDRIVICD